MKNLVEITALLEFKSKYNLENIDLKHTKKTQILFSLYHFGYETIKNSINKTHEKEFKNVSKKDWLYYLSDLNALMTQLTEKNYTILLNDIKNS